MQFFTYTSQGPRPSNQDCMSIAQIKDLGVLLCVADGVGGNKGGEVASQLAIKTFISCVENENFSMSEAMAAAHEKILEAAKENEDLTGMATTFTAVLISNNRLCGIHCGDSRAYVLRENGIKQLSHDHSEVAKYLREGKLTKEDALVYPRKNILYSALGSHKDLVIDEFDFSLRTRDRVVVLTDGFYGVVPKKMFRDISLASKDIQKFGDNLVDYIESIDTTDNYTIAAVEIA